MPKELIARGRTAEVYVWETGKIVKVYLPEFSAEDAKYEAQIAKVVQESGIACPHFFEQIEIEGRSGLVYERINGVTMGELALKAPWRIPALAQRMAFLHWQMHQLVIDAKLPIQRQRITHRIEHSEILNSTLKSRLLNAYAQLPDENRLCHGDFHPGNILSTSTKDLAIDWIDVSTGHPMADVARSSILLLGMAATTPNQFIKLAIRWFHRHYLSAYFQSGGNPALYRAFIPPVAAARLQEGITELQDWLLEQAQKQ